MVVTIEVRNLVHYCPLLKEKCLDKKCVWHLNKGCSVVRIAKRIGRGKENIKSCQPKKSVSIFKMKSEKSMILMSF